MQLGWGFWMKFSGLLGNQGIGSILVDCDGWKVNLSC